MPTIPFSSAEAVELGNFILAAYDLFTAHDPADFVPPGGYALVARIYADDITDGVPDYKVFGFIARNEIDVVVAIRGTQGLFEWVNDFFFMPMAFPYCSAGKTERGFTRFYSTLRTGDDPTAPRVAEALRLLVADGTVKTLRIAGHSLGGALATLLALDLAGNGIFVPRVVTFGSPKVGDKVFAGTYDDWVPDSWRVANLNDLVPHLPPQQAGYVHVDAEVPVNSDVSTQQNLRCWHSLRTYLNALDPSVSLDVVCVPT